MADFVNFISSKSENQKIEYKEFYELTSHHIFIKKVFDWELIIPHFQLFKQALNKAYNEVKVEEKY